MRTIAIPPEFLAQISGVYVDQVELRRGSRIFRRSTFIDGGTAARLLQGRELTVVTQSRLCGYTGNLRTSALVVLMDGTQKRYEVTNGLVWAPDDRPGSKALGKLGGFLGVITSIMEGVPWKTVNVAADLASLPRCTSPDNPAAIKEAPG